MRRAVLALSAAAVLGGAALPSYAAVSAPVGVTTDTQDGVAVGTTVNGQPGAGVAVRDGRACVVASLQLPVCADLPQVAR